MTGTKSLTTKLQKYDSLLNLPCSDSQIEILKDKLGVNFTDDVIELYKHHDGMQPSQIFPFRFMSISEVVETEINFTDWLNDSKTDVSGDNKLSLFWTDDNSNYAGFCLSEKLKGMICIINHDEIDLTPVFKDVFSFYESLLKVAEQNSHLIENDSDDCLIDWNEMETDFPRLFSSKIHDEDDSELANHFIELFNSEPNDQKKSHFAFCAMNVIPFDQTEKIYAFSESENMWIQERACEILGRKRYKKAIPILTEIAKNGTHNGRIAAMCALRQFGIEESETAIEKLLSEVDDSYKIYLKPKLKEDL